MEPQNRPIIKVPLTRTDIIIEVLCVATLLCSGIYTFVHYNALPDIIPTHYNGSGKVDGYGGKESLFIMPVIALAMYIGLTFAIRFPHKFNYMTEITEANAAKQYSITVRMLRVLKLSVVIIFFLIDYATIKASLTNATELGGGFMLLVMSLIFVPLFYFLIQLSKNS